MSSPQPVPKKQRVTRITGNSGRKMGMMPPTAQNASPSSMAPLWPSFLAINCSPSTPAIWNREGTVVISSMADRDTLGKAAAISGTSPVTAFSEADTRQLDSRAIFKTRFLF